VNYLEAAARIAFAADAAADAHDAVKELDRSPIPRHAIATMQAGLAQSASSVSDTSLALSLRADADQTAPLFEERSDVYAVSNCDPRGDQA
jgi:hypothetical protein